MEKAYRQSAAIVTQLGLLGIGLAAFVDTERELLSTRIGALESHSLEAGGAPV